MKTGERMERWKREGKETREDGAEKRTGRKRIER